MKFSIIMASYNQGEFIEQAIKSVLNQTYKNFELIIIDGMSTDNTPDIINKYKSHSNVKVIQEKDKGLYHARNKGLLLATGDIISFLNSDDYYEPDSLKEIYNVFNNNEVDIVYGITKAVDKEGNFLWNMGQPFNKKKFISHFKTIPDPSTFFKSINLSLIGLYDTSLRFGGDGDFWQRCINLNLSFYFYDKTITNYRVYNETLTYKPELKKYRFKETIKIHRRYYTKIFSPYIIRLYYTYFIKHPLYPVYKYLLKK
ncbi:MAG TPA: glycosyltransferase [Bacteroidales bacterium]|nr:glycosyltransferase [Bacteroidales bacterium]